MPAAAQSEAVEPASTAGGWYFGGAVGASVGGKTDATVTDGGGTIAGDLDYDTGALLSVSAGKPINPNVRIEGEMVITDNGIQDTGLDMQHVGILGNVFYDFKPEGAMSPYVGAGLGFGRAIVELDDASANDTGLAWQVRAGVSIRASETMVWDIGYRYLDQADFNAAEDGVAIDLAGSLHVISIGLRFGA